MKSKLFIKPFHSKFMVREKLIWTEIWKKPKYLITFLKVQNHIVPHKKFDRIGGTSSATFPNFKYVAPREICVERNCFDCPIAK